MYRNRKYYRLDYSTRNVATFQVNEIDHRQVVGRMFIGLGYGSLSGQSLNIAKPFKPLRYKYVAFLLQSYFQLEI